MGKKLTANDLKTLYTLYDHQALPAEAVRALRGSCGPARASTRWTRRSATSSGWSTCAAAAAKVLRLLDIQPRPLVEREKHYIETWDAMGFDNDALREAYERTIMKKQSLDWRYNERHPPPLAREGAAHSGGPSGPETGTPSRSRR